MLPFPETFLIQTLCRPIFLALFFAVVVAAASGIIVKSDRLKTMLANLASLCAYSTPVILLAFVSGYLSGISRVGVVGNVVPAVLSLVGGICIYVFGTESRFKAIVGYCVMMFAVSLLYGVQTGAVERQIGREAYIDYLSAQEKRIRDRRYNLGLPEDPPGWVVPKDEK